jgi:hypothetical protein
LVVKHQEWISQLSPHKKLGNPVLTHAGKISAELAQKKALEEYEVYRKKSLDELSDVEKQFIASIEQAQEKLKIAGTTQPQKSETLANKKHSVQ